jgi:hypothetical protein
MAAFVKNIVKFYIPPGQQQPEIVNDDKFGRVISRVLKPFVEKSKGKGTNLQVAYAPVVGRFRTAIKELLDDLDAKITATPPPVNLDELEALKKEVEQYKKAVEQIAKVITVKNPLQVSDAILNYGPSPTPTNEAISKDQISQLVPNVLNKTSTKGTDKILRIKDDDPPLEILRKRIMLQLRLIGRRMDKLTGQAPKSVADEDILTGLRDSGVELDDTEYKAAKEQYKTADKAAYATGLLGFIKSLYTKGSRAFKNLLDIEGRSDDQEKLLQDIIGSVYANEISILQDSYEEAGYNITNDDTILNNVVKELVKKPNDRQPIIVDIQEREPIFIQKKGTTYEAVSVQKIVNSVKTELLKIDTYKNFMNQPGEDNEDQIKSFAEQVTAKLPPSMKRLVNYYNAFEEYTLYEKLYTENLIVRAVKMHRDSRRLPEVKKRKAVKILIHLIEAEMRKHKNQESTKRIQHG